MATADLIQQIQAVLAEAEPQIKACSTPEELANTKASILGKKGSLGNILKGLKDVPGEDRPKVGAEANKIRDQIQQIIDQRTDAIQQAKIAQKISAEKIDVTLPGYARRLGARHPLTQTIEQMIGVLRKLGFSVVDGPEVETDFCNFEALNFPADHPARDMQDSIYIQPGVLLRTQTSTMQIRTMLGDKPPIKVVAPGAVYRNEAVDATHSTMFHQVEGLYVDENVSMAELKGTLEFFAREFFGAKTKIRLRPSFFPFTEPSVEVDVSCIFCGGKGCGICKQSGFIEVLGAGMVNPNLYGFVGYEPGKYTGFAFGMGVERIAMLLYGIDDIRLFYQNDVRFLEQFV